MDKATAEKISNFVDELVNRQGGDIQTMREFKWRAARLLCDRFDWHIDFKRATERIEVLTDTKIVED